MSNLKVYENILVSGVEYDFSQHPHELIPHRLLADWIALVGEIAKAINAAFNMPDLPESFEFLTERVPSDAPYCSDENFYLLDLVYFELIGEANYGLKISFENGRRSGSDSIVIETIKYSTFDKSFQPNSVVSSNILKAAKSPLAEFYIRHETNKTGEIKDIFARHREDCLSHARK